MSSDVVVASAAFPLPPRGTVHTFNVEEEEDGDEDDEVWLDFFGTMDGIA